MSWGDRTLGILLGVVIGVLIVIGFVFLGSTDTIDAPSLKGGQAEQQAPAQVPAGGGEAPAP
ncbi:MAG: hypothetical protein EXQ70_00040 [Solirubrobacterales bacterium]|nr:hypothetical protein [Solirubrobacterales bacterium]